MMMRDHVIVWIDALAEASLSSEKLHGDYSADGVL